MFLGGGFIYGMNGSESTVREEAWSHQDTDVKHMRVVRDHRTTTKGD